MLTHDTLAVGKHTDKRNRFCLKNNLHLITNINLINREYHLGPHTQKSVIYPLLHTWAEKGLRLASVALIDTGETVLLLTEGCERTLFFSASSLLAPDENRPSTNLQMWRLLCTVQSESVFAVWAIIFHGYTRAKILYSCLRLQFCNTHMQKWILRKKILPFEITGAGLAHFLQCFMQ